MKQFSSKYMKYLFICVRDILFQNSQVIYCYIIHEICSENILCHNAVYVKVLDVPLLNLYKTVEYNVFHLIRRVQTLELKRTVEYEAKKQKKIQFD